MANTPPNNQHSLHDIDGGGSINTTQHARKHDKLRKFLGILKSKTKDLRKSISSSVAAHKHVPISQPTKAKTLSIGFAENLLRPALKTNLPALLDRIEKTDQLVYCGTLLLQATATTAMTMKPTLTDKELKWLTEMDKNPMEKERIRWLAITMVDEFIQDPNKDSDEIAEVVALGPILDREPYRKLLSSIIGGFEGASILDTSLLRGIVQLVQSASPGFLVSDDLIKIFNIIRVHLERTDQNSSEHSLHLTLAVSRVLGVIGEHEVKDLNRIEENEPLSGVLSALKDSSDPYLMYQACYVYQALQYVPDDEPALQAAACHSAGVVDGLVKVTAVFKLDLGAVLEGLGKLQEALGGVIRAEGVCTVMESGQGVLASLKGGLGSGKKHPWYTAIRAAYALVQAGQLKDLTRLIYEAPCRRDPLFQWGICQLLGEIASDVVWDTSVRQCAVAQLGELYKNVKDWGQDQSVGTWMLEIISQISGAEDQAVSSSALTLLQELKRSQDTNTRYPYPLRHRLPLPSSSQILARVQNIPFVEYDLHRFRVQRLNQSHQSVYIPPLAKTSLKAKDDNFFPLMEKVQEFLAGERQVMLVLGDSGAGKSTFNRHLEHLLWTDYKQGSPIPLFINLPSIHEPNNDLVAKQLRDYNFEDHLIKELKLHRQLVLICDGYDESQQLVNLHYTNKLNQPGQWNTKMIISCRTQFLGPTYLDRFRPQAKDRYSSGLHDVFQEAVLAPFTKDQIHNYVEQYANDPATALLFMNQSVWLAEEYMKNLAVIPNVMDLVKNPFLLTLALKALPRLVASNKDLTKIRVTRVRLYDMFIDQWLETNKARLWTNNLSRGELKVFNSLVDDDFVGCGIDYLMRLAEAIFMEQDGNPIVHYNQRQDKGSWKEVFFCSDDEVKLLRDASPLMRAGYQYRFVHRSILEYLLSRIIYNPFKSVEEELELQGDVENPTHQLLNPNNLLFKVILLKEQSIIQFLCDRVKSNPDFEQDLRSVVNLSKTDSSVANAATNAITILVKAGALFHGADLRGIKIPGADLSYGQFDSAQLQGADLRDVIFSRSWLRQADLSSAQLEGVQFGELPYLYIGDTTDSCTYSPDGRMLAVSSGVSGVGVYDTSTWTVIPRFTTDDRVLDMVFSPNSQQIVLAGRGGVVRLHDCTSGEEVLVMTGHTARVFSVAFSPCGKQIASAGEDLTVWLWDSQTGESQFVMKGHTSTVTGVTYSSDGRYLVSGSKDNTIRFWNPQTGGRGVVLCTSSEVHCLAYSSDGRWIASGHADGVSRLWNADTRKPGPVLRGHSFLVTGIEFSPCGQWVASSSYDKTVRLWDAYNGTLLTVWAGHGEYVECVAFSPDGGQIASGGVDRKVRLWEVGSALSSLYPRDEVRVRQMAYAPDGRTVLAQDYSEAFRTWKLDAGTGASYGSLLWEVAEPQSVWCVESTRDGSQLAVGYENGSIHLRNRQTAGPILKGHSSKICKLVYSPCCRWIASVDDGCTVQLWDLYNIEQHRVLVKFDYGSEGMVCSVVFSPTGDQLAVGSLFGTVCLFNLPYMEPLNCSRFLEEKLKSVAYSPNGLQVAIGGWEGSVYLWDLQSEKPGAKLSGHESFVEHIDYSPCGQWIASGSDDRTVGIWRRKLLGEVESWSKVHSICSFFGSVYNVAWNPVVPMELATVCEDGSIRVWRLSADKGGSVVANMLWGSNIGVLCVEGLILDDATCLSPINQRMVFQGGAVSLIAEQKEQE